MRRKAISLSLAGLLLTAGAAPGQRAPTSKPETVVQETRELADDIAIGRALTAAGFTREQLERLLPVLEEGFRQLEEGDRVAATEIARLAEALEQQKRALLAGREADPQPEQQYQAAVRRFASAREAYRRGFRERVRTLLRELLSDAQKGALPNAARPAVLAQRLGQLEPPPLPAWVARPGGERAGAPGGLEPFPGGPGSAFLILRDGFRGDAAGELDRLRSTAAEEYPRQRLRFALEMAGLRAGFRALELRGPARGADGPGPGAPGGRGPDGDRPRVSVIGPGREAPPLNLQDPALQARLRPYLQLADRVRAMSPQQYEQQRARLAAQLDAVREQQRQEREAQREISPDEALNALVDVYLMNPRSVHVLKARLGKE